MSLSICNWKYGKQWVYSITYDEALEELHRFAIPHHEAVGVPGHVEAVAGHIGVVRQLGQSSYNGMMHMGPKSLQELIGMGWGVGNHTWSHEVVKPDMVDREIGEAKKVLEDACQAPVPLYCAAGSNVNMADHVLAACRKYGYLGAMSITDGLNTPDQELFWLDRTALHVAMYEPFYNEYDPYRNIRYAQAKQGWIIDYCHCPLEEAVHPHKDCTEAQLRERLETVVSEGGDQVWCANPDEVIYYHTTRRNTKIERVKDVPEEKIFRLDLSAVPKEVANTALTFEAEVPVAWCQNPHVWTDKSPVAVQVVRPKTLRFTVTARDGMRIGLRRTPLASLP